MITEENLKSYINKGLSLKEIANQLQVSYNTVLRHAKKFKLKSKIGTQGARKHRFDEDFFKTIDTEEKAYWLGFIAADGCVYKNSNAWRLQINLKESDIEHLSKFQKAIKSDYKIAQKTVGNSKVCQLKINSKIMCFDLIELEITERKSLMVKMPCIKEDLIRHYIRGYFDGDGNIKNFVDKNNRHRHNFNIVGGQDMLNSINKKLPCKIDLYKIKRTQSVFSLETTAKEKLIKIYDFLYDDATVFLERKKDIFSNLMSRFAEMQRQ